MTSTQIITKIAQERMVEEMIELLNSKEKRFNLQDLAQDIYLSLLEKEPEKIEALYNNGELRWFIQRMITNNVFSTTSPYAITYKKFDKATDELGHDKKVERDRHQ